MPHIHELYDFTVSAFILHPTENKLCLINHRKLHMWLQPGGHIELNEDPWQALTHELLEETGLILEKCEVIEPAEQPKVRGLKTLPLPFHFNVHDFNDDHKHIDLEYIIRSYTNELAPAEGESKEIGWFTLKEIQDLNSKKILHDGTLDICKFILDRQV